MKHSPGLSSAAKIRSRAGKPLPDPPARQRKTGTPGHNPECPSGPMMANLSQSLAFQLAGGGAQGLAQLAQLVLGIGRGGIGHFRSVLAESAQAVGQRAGIGSATL